MYIECAGHAVRPRRVANSRYRGFEEAHAHTHHMQAGRARAAEAASICAAACVSPRSSFFLLPRAVSMTRSSPPCASACRCGLDDRQRAHMELENAPVLTLAAGVL